MSDLKEIRNPLSPKDVFLFWLPLAAMWVLMGIEQPILTAFIARLPHAKENLAAYGIAFSIALIVEAPVIMVLTVTTALAGGIRQYRRLLNFVHLLAVGLTLLHLLIGLTPLYRLIVVRVIGASENLLDSSWKAFLLLTPWSAGIGYRRLWQGMLIRAGRTAVIPVTMVTRIVAVVMVCIVGLETKAFSGANVGAAALSIGVLASAGIAYLYTRSTIRKIASVGGGSETLSWRRLLSFYIPLALTSVIYLGSQPLLTFGMARALYPLESLAVWPVLTGFFFLFRSFAVALQEAAVALLQDWNNYRTTRNFSLWLAGILGIAYLVTAITPLSDGWFRFISGLPKDLLPFTRAPLLILAIVPPLHVLSSLYRSVHICHGKNRVVTQGVGIGSLFLALCAVTGGLVLPWSGIVIASLALMLSVVSDWTFLWYKSRSVLKRKSVDTSPLQGNADSEGES